MVWISPEITILKAIHNTSWMETHYDIGVNQSWNYNFESHSQLVVPIAARHVGCESVLKLQFWKPFTTIFAELFQAGQVWISPEITILKAIHNRSLARMRYTPGVNQSWNYNFESHSQQKNCCIKLNWRCESVLKLQFWKPFTTIEVFGWPVEGCESVLKLQFWKPFTTGCDAAVNTSSVWISPEITILKAIHNVSTGRHLRRRGVNQSWNYNFESHSQPPPRAYRRRAWCESVLKLQFWKPFTTKSKGPSTFLQVWISPEITILKAIHNLRFNEVNEPVGVNQSWNYNFESHSQREQTAQAI